MSTPRRVVCTGGVSLRKGTDILLEAYRRAFTAADDVCLVLKDHSGDLFYRENHARDRITDLRADPLAPEILHIDEFLPEEDLAALLRHYEGDIISALVAYNSGPKRPTKVPENGETPEYVVNILGFYRSFLSEESLDAGVGLGP